MQEIMGRNHIPANVPFDQLASTGSMPPGRMYQGWLSSDEQRSSTNITQKWVNDTRKNDRDDIAKDVRHMQEIMARKNIPRTCPSTRLPARDPLETAPSKAIRGLSGGTACHQMTSAISTDTIQDGWTTLVPTIRPTLTGMLAICRGESWLETTSPPTYPSIRLQVPQIIPLTTIRVREYGKGDSPRRSARVLDRCYADWLEDTRKTIGMILIGT